jgi:hypothetical protein
MIDDELKSLIDTHKVSDHAKQSPVKVTFKYSYREIVEVTNLLRVEITVEF